MSVMEGVCPNCGAHYCGWALRNPIPQSCGKCGSDLEIRRNGVLIQSRVSTPNAAVVDKLLGPRFILSADLTLIKN